VCTLPKAIAGKRLASEVEKASETVVNSITMMTCKRAARIVLRRTLLAGRLWLGSADSGVFSGLLQRIDGAIAAWVPLGYEDETGFHYGGKPGSDFLWN
jgi:hypothetical protein